MGACGTRYYDRLALCKRLHIPVEPWVRFLIARHVFAFAVATRRKERGRSSYSALTSQTDATGPYNRETTAYGCFVLIESHSCVP